MIISQTRPSNHIETRELRLLDCVLIVISNILEIRFRRRVRVKATEAIKMLQEMVDSKGDFELITTDYDAEDGSTFYHTVKSFQLTKLPKSEKGKFGWIENYKSENLKWKQKVIRVSLRAQES